MEYITMDIITECKSNWCFQSKTDGIVLQYFWHDMLSSILFQIIILKLCKLNSLQFYKSLPSV